MADKGSESIGIPEVFKNPQKIKIKSGAKKYKNKKKKKPSEAKPPDFTEISSNLSKNNSKHYLQSPPRSEKAAYCFHGEKTPDPFRPLEDVENEDVRNS